MGDTQKSPTQDLRERTRFTRKMGCPTSESVGYFRATEIGVQGTPIQFRIPPLTEQIPQLFGSIRLRLHQCRGVKSAQWSLSFVSKPDRDIVGGLFDSLKYIYEKIKKLDYEIRDRLSGDFGLLGVLTIIDESGLIDRDWQCFGTWHDYMRLCHNRIHEINEKLDAAGLELLDDQAFHPPEPDGRFIRSYRSLNTGRGSAQC